MRNYLIGNHPVKFLDINIEIATNQRRAHQNLEHKLSNLLTNIDKIYWIFMKNYQLTNNTIYITRRVRKNRRGGVGEEVYI